MVRSLINVDSRDVQSIYSTAAILGRYTVPEISENNLHEFVL